MPGWPCSWRSRWRRSGAGRRRRRTYPRRDRPPPTTPTSAVETAAARMRVLVVEDDPLLGDAIQAGLREMGHAVDWVRDGAAADAALRDDAYAAVVLDLG